MVKWACLSYSEISLVARVLVLVLVLVRELVPFLSCFVVASQSHIYLLSCLLHFLCLRVTFLGSIYTCCDGNACCVPVFGVHRNLLRVYLSCVIITINFFGLKNKGRTAER